MKGLHPVVFLCLLILIALPFGCKSWWDFKPNYSESSQEEVEAVAERVYHMRREMRGEEPPKFTPDWSNTNRYGN